MVVDSVQIGKPTAWERFKGNAKAAYNTMRGATLINAGLDPSQTPLRDAARNLWNQWIKPAAHDAKSLLQDVTGVDLSGVLSTAHDAKESLADIVAADGSDELGLSPAGSSGPTYSSSVPAQHAASTLNYVNADLAAHYGMDAKAAYSEALQNTAYQRAVVDLKKAGLNPVLVASGLSPAGSYVAGNTLAYGSGSGSSGGYRNGNSGKRLFDSDTYNLIGVAGTLIGGVAGMVASPNAPVLGASTGAMLGKQITQSLAQGASSVANKRK